MDYVQLQQSAKAENRWLLLTFGVVITIVAAMAAAAITFIAWVLGGGLRAWLEPASGLSEVGERAPASGPPWGWIFIAILVVIALIIGWVSLSRERALIAFGAIGIARSMGGRRIDNRSDHAAERQFVNAVEEIAIAARQLPPAVFVLDGEDGINVFNAGWTEESTVVGITSGALHELARDELQSVAAQAMSHVFHGDAQLNLRLMALVTGVAGLAIIGEDRIAAARPNPGSDDDRILMPLFLAGHVMRSIGWVGVWLSSSVQRVVARRHEFLADGTAVQLLRESDPMRDALRRIGGNPTRSRVRTRRARAVSHLFMADTSGRYEGGIHPDLRLRILRLDPSWTGDWLSRRADEGVDPRGWASVDSPVTTHGADLFDLGAVQEIPDMLLQSSQGFGGGASLVAPMLGAVIVNEATTAPSPLSVATAPAPLNVATAPAPLNVATAPAPPHQMAELDADDARCLVVALVHLASNTVPTQASVPPPCSVERVGVHLGMLQDAETIDRPALLRQVSRVLLVPSERSNTVNFAQAAIASLRPHEEMDHWVLRHLILLGLCPQTAPVKPRSLEKVRHDYATALSFMAAVGGGDTTTSFAVGASAAGLVGLGHKPPGKLRALDKAIDKLHAIGPNERQRALSGFEAVVDADMWRRPQERELLAVLAGTLAPESHRG